MTRLCLNVVLGFCSAVSASSASPVNPCELPHGLDAKLAAKFPAAHVVHLADLDDYDKKLYRKDHGSRCPGLVKVNFYGDEKPTSALVLLSGDAPRHLKAELLVARELESDWELRSLEVTDGAPVVWREPAGKYEGLYNEGVKTISARNPVIVFCGYESWSIVYAWNGEAVEKVWTSD